MRATRLALLFVAILALATLLAICLRGGRTSANITMCGTGKSGSNFLLYSYGTEKGIFQKHGLNVTYVAFRDVYSMLLAFFSGKVTTTSMSPGLAGTSFNSGETFRIGIAVAKSSDHCLLAKPGIGEFDQLRGCKLGVHGRTSDDYQVMKWYLETKGIDIESDLEVVEISSPSNLVTSFQTGQIDAVVLWGGYAVKVMESGGIPLVRAPAAVEELTGHPHYVPMLVFREESITDDGANIDAFLRSIREIAKEIEDNKEEAARIWADASGQPYETMLKVVELYTLLGDMNEEVKEGIKAFFELGVEKGYFETAPGDDIYYTGWK